MRVVLVVLFAVFVILTFVGIVVFFAELFDEFLAELFDD